MSELDVASELRNLHAAARQKAIELRAMANAASDEARRYEKALAALEGRVNKRPSPKPGTRRNGQAYLASEDRIKLTHEWLQANADRFPEGFHAAELSRQAGGELGSDPTVVKALNAMRERGLIRLDRQGPKGAKIYYLV